MKKIVSVITAALTILLSLSNAFAYSAEFSPNTGESMRNIYILVGLMAVALIAIIVIIIIRNRKK